MTPGRIGPEERLVVPSSKMEPWSDSRRTDCLLAKGGGVRANTQPGTLCARRVDVNSSDQQGYILVTTAILLVALLGFVAITADFGFFYTSRAGTQAVSDAAALAGASTFVFQATATQPGAAEEAVMATATQQKVLGKDVQSSEVSVDVDVGNRLVVGSAAAERAYFFRQGPGN